MHLYYQWKQVDQEFGDTRQLILALPRHVNNLGHVAFVCQTKEVNSLGHIPERLVGQI